MNIKKKSTRRQLLKAGLGGIALASAPAFIRSVKAAADFKIGLFIPLSGPAALFGPSAKNCGELAIDMVNESGGVLGRKAKLYIADAGVPPAEAAKSAMRLMLSEKVDLIVGNHDSAVRQAIVGAVKGRVPYVYSPVYEGGECSSNVFMLGETPQQQLKPTISHFAETKNVKSYYLIGNDYVWPRVTNKLAKDYIAASGGKVVGEQYIPFGPANKFESAVTQIKSANPDLVVITLVGGDNVNFNRTFAEFGLHKQTARVASLLEENTLMGIGSESSKNLYSSMAYFANIDSPENNAFVSRYKSKFGAKAAVLNTLAESNYAGIIFGSTLVNKAGSTNAAKLASTAEGLTLTTPTGPVTMRSRHTDKNMFLAQCKGTQFSVSKVFKNVPSGQTCS